MTNKINMEKGIKSILAILLLLCLLDWPYGYYQFVRFVAMVAFAYLALNANQKQYSTQVFVYIALALLFQPFFKIALGRVIWNVVDVVVAMGLVGSSILPKSKS